MARMVVVKLRLHWPFPRLCSAYSLRMEMPVERAWLVRRLSEGFIRIFMS
jgi:hypothetical protein